MLLAAALRCFRLGEQSLWIDEVFTWLTSGGMHPLGWKALRENVHGPLFSLIESGWMHVAGDAEWALRAPSVLFGVLTVPALAWLARRWLGRDVAIAAAWIAAASPFMVWYSQEARNYSLVMLCVCVATALVFEVTERPTARSLAAYLAATAAGMLSNLSFAFIAPLHLTKWWGPREGRAARLRRLAVVAAALIVIASPWVIQSFHLWDWNRLSPGREAPSTEAPLRGQTTFHPGAVPYAGYAFSVGYTFGPSLREMHSHGPVAAARAHAPAIAIALLVCGPLVWLGLLALRRRGRLGDALWWMVVPLVVVSYFAMHNFKVFHPRYVAVAAPAWLLLFASAFADLRPRGRWLFGVALGAIWTVSLAHHYFVPAYGKEDYRGAAAVIRAHEQPGEQVLAVYSYEPMEYYMRGALPVRPFWLGWAADRHTLDAKLDEALAAAHGTWVVLSRPEDLDPEGHFARRIETRFPDARAYRKTGVWIWRLPPGAAAGTD